MKIQNIILTITMILLSANSAYAQLGNIEPAKGTNINLSVFVTRIIDFAIGSGVVVFLIYFIWGALEWISSAGDKGAVQKARDRITYAAIGLIILSAVWAVYSIVQIITYSPTNT